MMTFGEELAAMEEQRDAQEELVNMLESYCFSEFADTQENILAFERMRGALLAAFAVDGPIWELNYSQ